MSPCVAKAALELASSRPNLLDLWAHRYYVLESQQLWQRLDILTGGAYLKNYASWNFCEEPPNVVSWNVTLFSLLVVASCLEILLCGIHLVNTFILYFVNMYRL
nr:transmembrane 4 L6 family member 5-like isoform X2 [Marmota flaviventris]